MDSEQVSTGGPPPPPDKSSNRGLIIAVLGALVVVLAIGGAGLVMVNEARQDAATARAEANEARAAMEEANAAAATAEAEAAAAAAEAKASEAAQETADETQRQARTQAVTEIEVSVAEMAEEHVADDLIEGPILDVSCSPVAGGSLDDLTEATTVFECFATNEELSDGRARGITYSATMNWSSGEYTYSLGAP